MSSSCLVSLSSFNLLFFTQVLTVLTTSTVKYNEYVTDKGKNISVPCDADGTIMWVKEDVRDNFMAQTGRVLHLTNVSEADGGVYVCLASRPGSRQPATKSESESEQSRTANVDGSEAPSLAANRTDVSEDLAPLSTSPLKPDRLPSTRGDDVDAATILAANKSVDDDTDVGLQVVERVQLNVRTPPGPVTQLYFKASTILGFLVWRFDNAMSGGYPVRSFTAEFRNVSYVVAPFNSSFEHEWNRMDPINIAPNVRQMEVYRLEPNTTYEFRIWANNQLGNGEVVTTNVTTLPETKEEDLIRLIQADLDNFDPRIWIVAVSIVLGTLVILAIGLCIVLSKECYQASHMGIESSDHTASSCSATITDCKLDIFMA